MIKDLYKQAIQEMIDNGEMDKVEMYANSQPTIKPIDAVQLFRHNIDVLTAEECKSVEDIPLVPLIVGNNSAELWKDIFCLMMAIESRESRNDQEPDRAEV